MPMCHRQGVHRRAELDERVVGELDPAGQERGIVRERALQLFLVGLDLGQPDGRRPVCVLTRDAAIQVLTAITCAPITRTIRGIRSEVEVGPEQGLHEPGVISCTT